MSSRNKIGFWAVTSIVLSSQIGSGIFTLPSGLAAYGGIGAASWLASGGGALLLALVFADLCRKFPKTGGPHAYVHAAFGARLGFFTAWSYWVISWISSSAVVIATIGYFGSIFGGFSPFTTLMLEIFLLVLFMGINLLGVRTSGSAEFIFTILKTIPLVVLPLACIPYFKLDNFIPFNISSMSNASALNTAALLTFWGFIGIETATTPAGSVENPERTIPRAIITGTIAVAVIYFFSSSIIMGVLDPALLRNSQAPFADAARQIFGGNWHMAIALAAGVVCIGTLNAWVLTSGQIALGAAEDNFFPDFFKKRNAHGAPIWGVIISSLGVIPLLFFTLKQDSVAQLNVIIETSVTAFILVYILCVSSYLKINYTLQTSLGKKMLGWFALAFCLWTLWGCEAFMVCMASVILISGVPVYIMQRHKFNTVS